MLDAPYGRAHALALRRDGRGLYCDEEGLWLGSIPLLDRDQGGGRRLFIPRPLDALNRDLARCYGLPVDAARKMEGLGVIAKALNDANPALACIAAVQLRLPEIPERAPAALAKCAVTLAESGLLKASPGDPKHPGYPKGAPGGKGGQFRPKEDWEKADDDAPVTLGRAGRAFAKAAAAKAIRILLKRALIGVAGSVFGPEVPVYETAALLMELGVAAYDGAVAAAPYVKAYLDPPKTLEELRGDAKKNREGYENHHVIEQATAAEDGSENETIRSPDNLVSIPTVKHWELNSWYEERPPEYDGLTRRQYLKERSLEERRQVGLEGLRKFGVLKP